MSYENHPLTQAARYNDARSEEQGMPRIVEAEGVDVDALLFVARQRALRAVVLTSRGPQALDAMTGNEPNIKLSRSENAMLQNLMLASLDGMMIGWVGRRYSEATERTEST